MNRKVKSFKQTVFL